MNELPLPHECTRGMLVKASHQASPAATRKLRGNSAGVKARMQFPGKHEHTDSIACVQHNPCIPATCLLCAAVCLCVTALPRSGQSSEPFGDTSPGETLGHEHARSGLCCGLAVRVERAGEFALWRPQAQFGIFPGRAVASPRQRLPGSSRGSTPCCTAVQFWESPCTATHGRTGTS